MDREKKTPDPFYFPRRTSPHTHFVRRTKKKVSAIVDGLGLLLVDCPGGYVLMDHTLPLIRDRQHADQGANEQLPLYGHALRSRRCGVHGLRRRQRSDPWQFDDRQRVPSCRLRQSALFGFAHRLRRHAAVHMVRGAGFTGRSHP